MYICICICICVYTCMLPPYCLPTDLVRVFVIHITPVIHRMSNQRDETMDKQTQTPTPNHTPHPHPHTQNRRCARSRCGWPPHTCSSTPSSPPSSRSIRCVHALSVWILGDMWVWVFSACPLLCVGQSDANRTWAPFPSQPQPLTPHPLHHTNTTTAHQARHHGAGPGLGRRVQLEHRLPHLVSLWLIY